MGHSDKHSTATSRGMKRYRVLGFDFDTRARILETEIDPNWEPRTREQWEINKADIQKGLALQYGSVDVAAKIKNFTDFGALPFSVLAFHNRFLRQIRDAFTIGAYYPALTGASALGERILNHLIIRLRGYFKATPEYKKVYSKDSFQDWEKALDVLDVWQVLLPDALAAFRSLAELRHTEAIHFNPNVDTDDRDPALRACRLLCKIVQSQFAAFGNQPWYIKNTPGVMFVSLEAEQEPFVKEIILPNCHLVGPKHKIVRLELPEIEVSDDAVYPDRELADDEFVEEWKKANQQGETKSEKRRGTKLSE